jgi:hypothetical protein
MHPMVPIQDATTATVRKASREKGALTIKIQAK